MDVVVDCCSTQATNDRPPGRYFVMNSTEASYLLQDGLLNVHAEDLIKEGITSNAKFDSASMSLNNTNNEIVNSMGTTVCDVGIPRQVSFAEGIACAIAILTILENALILIAITRGHRNLRKPPYWFIASLSLADLLTGVEVILAIFVPIGDDPLSRIVLKGLAVVMFISSVNSLLLVSLDRYIRIVHHTEYTKLLNRRTIVLLIAISWIFSFGIFLAGPILGWSCTELCCCAYDGLCVCMRNKYGDEVCGRYCSQSFVPFTKSYILAGLVYFAVSVVIMTTFYSVIFKVVREKTFSVGDFKSKRREVKLAKTLVITLGIFVICWLPVQALFVADVIITQPNNILSTAFDYALVPSVINSFMNPIIYSIRLPHMRSTIMHLVFPFMYDGQNRTGTTWVSSTSMEQRSFRKLSIRKIRGRNKSRSSSSDTKDANAPKPSRGRLMSD